MALGEAIAIFTVRWQYTHHTNRRYIGDDSSYYVIPRREIGKWNPKNMSSLILIYYYFFNTTIFGINSHCFPSRWLIHFQQRVYKMFIHPTSKIQPWVCLNLPTSQRQPIIVKPFLGSTVVKCHISLPMLITVGTQPHSLRPRRLPGHVPNKGHEDGEVWNIYIISINIRKYRCAYLYGIYIESNPLPKQWAPMKNTAVFCMCAFLLEHFELTSNANVSLIENKVGHVLL